MTGSTPSGRKTELQRLLERQWLLHGSDSEDSPPRDVAINAIPFQIGRRFDLNLCLKSRSVSGVHAEIVPRNELLLIRDLNSTNGTYINGERVVGEAVLNPGDLVQFADLVFRVVQDADSFDTKTHQAFDAAIPAMSQIDRLIRSGAVKPIYQPIVDLSDRSVIGYEVLARSEIEGLETPHAMFRAASQVRLQNKLSIVCRWKGLVESLSLPGDPILFLNLHRDEDLMTDVLDSLRTIRESFPRRKLLVELHEAAVPPATQMESFRQELRKLNVMMAFDDFGIGQSRLLDLVKVPPDILKFDLSLIRDVDQASEPHLKWLRTLIETSKELGIKTLAEGVETAGEAIVCRKLGFELAQGFHFGRPSAVDKILDHEKRRNRTESP